MSSPKMRLRHCHDLLAEMSRLIAGHSNSLYPRNPTCLVPPSAEKEIHRTELQQPVRAGQHHPSTPSGWESNLQHEALNNATDVLSSKLLRRASTLCAPSLKSGVAPAVFLEREA